MNPNETTEMDMVEMEQRRLHKAGKRLKKARKREQRRALLSEDDLEPARRAAEKRLRRLARRESEAMKSLHAVIYGLRD